MKILIADDSKAMRQVIGHMLHQAGYSGFRVVEAADGVEALEKTTIEAPDLVLSDWDMPNKSGIEFLQELRASGNEVPFGFVTTDVSPEMRSLATQSGATFLIGNPFMPEDFRRVLHACMR
ncbi:MAG: response regulator [Hydrogenophilaceae bacterium]|jgi:two-component system chemotaxis response regulator CheY|nr:response regulator [Hydrogenophilaceae bacterium]